MGNNKNPLEGFEDLYQHYTGDRRPKEKKDHSKTGQPKHDDFSKTYSFLENEHQRLRQLDRFFSYKLTNLEEHPQVDILTKDKESEIFTLKEELFKKLQHNDSSLQQQLKQIWDQVFRI